MYLTHVIIRINLAAGMLVAGNALQTMAAEPVASLVTLDPPIQLNTMATSSLHAMWSGLQKYATNLKNLNLLNASAVVQIRFHHHDSDTYINHLGDEICC